MEMDKNRRGTVRPLKPLLDVEESGVVVAAKRAKSIEPLACTVDNIIIIQRHDGQIKLLQKNPEEPSHPRSIGQPGSLHQKPMQTIHKTNPH
ncbi:MAG: hypothetical protein M0002_03775 [Rhodospirillales bacterium]|nr:hypothetical protein [Rhodospirillales bacterium]